MYKDTQLDRQRIGAAYCGHERNSTEIQRRCKDREENQKR